MNKPEKLEKPNNQNSYVKAVFECKAAHFNATNPHFKSKYANEKSCKEATDPALHANGLVMIHRMIVEPFCLITEIRGAGGEVVAESAYPLQVTKPQDMGSQITYARRYNRCALMGIIADEDDDGNGAQETVKEWQGPLKVTQLKEIIRGTCSEMNKVTERDTEEYVKGLWHDNIDAINQAKHDLPEFYQSVVEATNRAKKRVSQ